MQRVLRLPAGLFSSARGDLIKEGGPVYTSGWAPANVLTVDIPLAWEKV